MGRVEKSIEIKAPPEKVWEMLALDRFPEWQVGQWLPTKGIKFIPKHTHTYVLTHVSPYVLSYVRIQHSHAHARTHARTHICGKVIAEPDKILRFRPSVNE